MKNIFVHTTNFVYISFHTIFNLLAVIQRNENYKEKKKPSLSRWQNELTIFRLKFNIPDNNYTIKLFNIFVLLGLQYTTTHENIKIMENYANEMNTKPTQIIKSTFCGWDGIIVIVYYRTFNTFPYATLRASYKSLFSTNKYS